MKPLPLTPAQLTWAEWALDPMLSYWTTQQGAYERNGRMYDPHLLPTLEGRFLHIPDMTPVEILEDLLWRLEEQAPSVCETDATSHQQVTARSRAPLALAQRIRLGLGNLSPSERST